MLKPHAQVQNDCSPLLPFGQSDVRRNKYSVLSVVLWLQGEYVSVSRLEEIYVGNSKLIHQMYIYGNSLRAYLVAIVVPTLGASLLKCCLAQIASSC